nr:helix-turn-helix domain-containing protein [Mycolicibacterium mageritense]
MTLPEAAAALRITTRHLRTLRRQGLIGTVHLGSRVLVPYREILRLVDEALDGEGRPPAR